MGGGNPQDYGLRPNGGSKHAGNPKRRRSRFELDHDHSSKHTDDIRRDIGMTLSMCGYIWAARTQTRARTRERAMRKRHTLAHAQRHACKHALTHTCTWLPHHQRTTERRASALRGNVRNLVVMIRWGDHSTRVLPTKEMIDVVMNNNGRM